MLNIMVAILDDLANKQKVEHPKNKRNRGESNTSILKLAEIYLLKSMTFWQFKRI